MELRLQSENIGVRRNSYSLGVINPLDKVIEKKEAYKNKGLRKKLGVTHQTTNKISIQIKPRKKKLDKKIYILLGLVPVLYYFWSGVL